MDMTVVFKVGLFIGLTLLMLVVNGLISTPRLKMRNFILDGLTFLCFALFFSYFRDYLIEQSGSQYSLRTLGGLSFATLIFVALFYYVANERKKRA